MILLQFLNGKVYPFFLKSRPEIVAGVHNLAHHAIDDNKGKILRGGAPQGGGFDKLRNFWLQLFAEGRARKPKKSHHGLSCKVQCTPGETDYGHQSKPLAEISFGYS